MLIIRLQRTGKRNQADFRIVLAEKTAPVEKKFVEVLGSYNPRRKDFKTNEERLKYWLGQKVEVSPTVHNLLVTKGLVTEGKVKSFNIPKKPAETAPGSAETSDSAKATSDETSDKPAAEAASAEAAPAPEEKPAA